MSTREQIRQSATPASAPKVAAPTAARKETPAPKAKPEPKTCACQVPGPNGCGNSTTTRIFAPGHDAKLIGFLTRQVVSGEMTAEVAATTLALRSNGSRSLAGKLATAIPRELAKAKTIKARAEAKQKAADDKAKKMQFAKDQAAAAKADREAREKAGS